MCVIPTHPNNWLLCLLAHITFLALPWPAIRAQVTNEEAIHPLPLGSASWSTGFWAQRWKSLQEDMIPSMWDLMKGDDHKPFYQHFEIAAGLREGTYHGAQWNDGDFYKWIESVCLLMASKGHNSWDATLDQIIEVIGLAQADDGYLHTPTLIRQRNGDTSARPFQNRFNFEMYNMGHLMTTACVHHQVTGKDSFLQIAIKAGAFLEKAFEQPTPALARNAVCPSHYMGLMDLYRETQEPRWLQLATHLIAMRDLVEEGGDDNQDRQPLREHREIHGHAVRANYLYAGVTDLFLENKDASLWPALQTTWKNLMAKKVYITGGCGALYDGASPDGSVQQSKITRVHQAYGRNYQLPNLTAHSETCANIGAVLWHWRLFQATGEAAYMDAMEQALYNSILSGVDLDGKHFFYVNPLRNLNPSPVALRWSRQRVPFVTSFCCPPNLLRTVARTPDYAYAVSHQTLWVNLFGSGKVEAPCPGVGKISLTQSTEYPWKDTIQLKIDSSPSEPWTLAIRVPGWTDRAALKINGETIPDSISTGKYQRVRRVWRAGDRVQLALNMPAQLIETHPQVEENRGQVALKRGPIVYCLEGVDLPAGTSMTDVAIATEFQAQVEHQPNLLGGIHTISGNIRIHENPDWQGKLYRPYQPHPHVSMRAQFIPYYTWANRAESEMSVWLPLAP